MTGKLLVKGIIVWIAIINWLLFLIMPEDISISGLFFMLSITLVSSYIAYTFVSYLEFKKVSGYSYICKLLNLPEDEE